MARASPSWNRGVSPDPEGHRPRTESAGAGCPAADDVPPDAGFSFSRLVETRSDWAPAFGPAAPGGRIGDYRLIALLARGGQGEVWEAQQLTLGRRVALKLMLPGRIGSRALAQFLREARAGGRLSHPGIVTVHDQGTDDGRAWIAMELVEGACTLEDSIAQAAAARTLPADYNRRCALLLAEIADALEAAHRAGVIHRDVKPGNVLITPQDHPKITDFGLARIDGEQELSRDGDVMGTFAYMSPEQVAARRKAIDERTDIFSLGVVAYELLTLQRPFTGRSAKEIADRIRGIDPPDPRRVRSRIPRDLAVICTKAMAKAPRDRYASMSELAADLRRFLAAQVIHARPPSMVRRLACWARRHPTGRAVSLTALVTSGAIWTMTRAPTPLPFTGPTHQLLNVTSGKDDDHSPTFAGNRYLVFERHVQGHVPGLWYADLDSDLTARPWSPQGEMCTRPAISPDGRWLVHEAQVGGDGVDLERAALVVRPLAVSAIALPWPTTESERLESEGSLGGVAWSHADSFLYTRELGAWRELLLHRLGTPFRDDRELLRLPAEHGRPVQACFSPDDSCVLAIDANRMRVLPLEPGAAPIPPWSLDCGLSTDPVWLADGSVLFSRQSSGGKSAHLYRRSEAGTVRMGELEKLLMGTYRELALSGDGSMLAMTARIESESLFVISPDGLHVQQRPRFPVTHPVWTPEGGILYCGSTPQGYRLFVLETDSGGERMLELDLPFLETFGENYQLDQPSFSQNHERLVFRAKGEPLNERCDPREWIVLSTWPLRSGGVRALSTGGRHIAFPHVDDAGNRVIWSDPLEKGTGVYGARVDGNQLAEVERRMYPGAWPAQLSGDGRRIVAAILGEPGWLRAVAWEGPELVSVRDDAVRVRPIWMPTETGSGDRLACLRWEEGLPERYTVEVRDAAAREPARDEGVFPAPSENPGFVSWDPGSGRLTYTIGRRDPPGNIWLARPAAKGAMR